MGNSIWDATNLLAWCPLAMYDDSGPDSNTNMVDYWPWWWTEEIQGFPSLHKSSETCGCRVHSEEIIWSFQFLNWFATCSTSPEWTSVRIRHFRGYRNSWLCDSLMTQIKHTGIPDDSDKAQRYYPNKVPLVLSLAYCSKAKGPFHYVVPLPVTNGPWTHMMHLQWLRLMRRQRRTQSIKWHPWQLRILCGECLQWEPCPTRSPRTQVWRTTIQSTPRVPRLSNLRNFS